MNISSTLFKLFFQICGTRLDPGTGSMIDYGSRAGKIIRILPDPYTVPRKYVGDLPFFISIYSSRAGAGA